MSQAEGARGWAARGGPFFAAILIVMVGIWQLFLGVAALGEKEFFIVDPTYLFDFSAVAWGWVHLLVGAALFVVGFALTNGSSWARLAGILLAALTAIIHFLFLPYYPIGSLVVILLAVYVMRSLAGIGTSPGATHETA